MSNDHNWDLSREMTFDETMAFWKDFLSRPDIGRKVDRLKDRCVCCQKLLQHGHIHFYADGGLHDGCEMAIRWFLEKATPEDLEKARRTFKDDNYPRTKAEVETVKKTYNHYKFPER